MCAFWKLEASLVCFLAPSSLQAPTNEGLFELTRHPSLTQAVSSSFGETTENLVLVRSQWLSHLTNQVLRSFCGWRRDGPCQRKAPSQLKKPYLHWKLKMPKKWPFLCFFVNTTLLYTPLVTKYQNKTRYIISTTYFNNMIDLIFATLALMLWKHHLVKNTFFDIAIWLLVQCLPPKWWYKKSS